jgi:DNA modification methylase
MERSIAHQRREELTFKANLRWTRYGWLRLTPAYSVHLVRELINRADPVRDEVLDPFCGTGTTALVCAEHGISSTTTDINPFLVWLARAKCAVYTCEAIAQFNEASSTVKQAILSTVGIPEWTPPIHQIEKWWNYDTLHALARAMAAIRGLETVLPNEVVDLLRIAFCRIMIGSANVHFGHQSMSFCSPPKETGLFAWDPCEDLSIEWERAVKDLAQSASTAVTASPHVLICDARKLVDQLRAERYSLVITSPPYPNRMSYIRELRPYMYWLGYLRDGKEAGEMDWQAIGGTWGIATSRLTKWDAADGLKSQPKIATACEEIAKQSDILARYVARYFVDMIEHISQLYRVVKPGGKVHYIVGNSKFYDVLLPVERFFGALLNSTGFVNVEIRQLRKRSSKRELFEYCVTATKK